MSERTNSDLAREHRDNNWDAAHEASPENVPRRAPWRKTVILKDLLSADDADDTTRECAAGFAHRLKRLSEHDTDPELQEMVMEFEDIAQSLDTPPGDVMLCDWFNSVLSNLYDWADGERIWIGGECG